MVENARLLALGHSQSHESFVVTMGQVPIGIVVCPENFVKAGLTKISLQNIYI